jgi:protein-tyrosine phosphatase
MSHIQYDSSGELHITDITEARTIDKSKFDKVITVCQDSIADNVSEEIVYSFYCMSDGPGPEQEKYGGSCDYSIFSDAADELYESLESDESVLIHCHHGISRSVSVSAAALGRLLGIDRSAAFDLIHTYRAVHKYPDKNLSSHAKRYINEQS